MFGWEFPPHISGGLGTACYGLTKALVNRGTQILFVVPRAFGDEEMNLIDASEILISEPDKMVLTNLNAHIDTPARLEVIGVPSGIKPYTFGSQSQLYAIENWSYEIQSATQEIGKAKKYKFSGTYGSQLLEEVISYSEVAVALAKHHSFDVIHAHDWLTYQAGIKAKEVSGKPLVMHVHATEFDRAAQIDPQVYAIEREGFEKADRIVAVSDRTKRILVSRYGIPQEKISVVHNGIVAKKKQAAVSAPRLGKKIVSFLGRITYQKGPHYFVEAARKVLLHLPDVHFVMAGSGDLLPAVIERVAQLRLSSRFHFTGFLKGSQVDKIWSMSDLYVMPSVSEPFGLASLEAIQSGVPVIISKQSGVAEVMPHAIAVNFWEVDRLANAMLHVLRRPSLSNTLRKNSKQSLKQITWETAAIKINHLYHELASKN